MEGNEMEMTKEELQKWIRGKVKKNELIVEMLEKCNLLRSLLERRENQAVHLLQLCKSVAACEAIVKKQYSLLGWEYRETDSDGDNNVTGCEKTPTSTQEFAHAETQDPSFPITDGPTPLLTKLGDSVYLCTHNGKKRLISLERQPVVVLTRLSPCKISSLLPPTLQNPDSEDESSDTQWEPDEDSSDSDFSISSYNPGPNKRRKMDQKKEERDKSPSTQQASTNTGAESNAAKTSTPQANANTKAKSNTMKTSTPPANTNGVLVSTLCQSSNKATKTQDPPNMPEGNICVNMNVLACRKAMGWQWGKILEMVTKDDGRLKYKINFEDKGKSLVSGHHIAFDCAPKLDQLFVGARVVVKCEDKMPQFCPGIVAELPSRKNQSRFLVFLDDDTPVYVALPLLHLVCKPLANPLDDIVNDTHRNFVKEYLDVWPYPPRIQYRVGQIINAELNGVQQKCEVQVVDCSLIKVVFQNNQHKDCIYRGSPRLEHMINMREDLVLKKGGQKNKLPVNESSKSAH